jgi:dihydrofolate reductase
MNNIPKYVLSRTLSQASWTNTTVLAADDVVDRIRALKQEPGQSILQYGYGPVTRLLIEHGLLDELHITHERQAYGDSLGDKGCAAGSAILNRLQAADRA